MDDVWIEDQETPEIETYDNTVVFEELDSYFEPERLAPGEFTLQQVKEHWKMSAEGAKKRMKKLVDQGIYQAEKRYLNGNMNWIYRKSES